MWEIYFLMLDGPAFHYPDLPGRTFKTSGKVFSRYGPHAPAKKTTYIFSSSCDIPMYLITYVCVLCIDIQYFHNPICCEKHCFEWFLCLSLPEATFGIFGVDWTKTCWCTLRTIQCIDKDSRATQRTLENHALSAGAAEVFSLVALIQLPTRRTFTPSGRRVLNLLRPLWNSLTTPCVWRPALQLIFISPKKKLIESLGRICNWK